MAIRDVYNFKSDPYYKDLYDSPSLAGQVVSAFNQYQQMQNAQLKNSIAEQALKQKQRQLDSASQISDLMQSGALSSREDIYAAIERSALDSGDVDSYLKVAKTREAENQDQDQEDWNTVQRLKQISPALAEQHYNQTLGSKYGMAGAGSFQEKPKMQIIDGQVFYVDENNQTITPGQRVAPSSRGRSGEYEPDYYVSPDGKKTRYFNPKDPANFKEIARLLEQGYRKSTSGEQGKGGSFLQQLLTEGNAPIQNSSPVPNSSPIPSAQPQPKVRKLVF